LQAKTEKSWLLVRLIKPLRSLIAKISGSITIENPHKKEEEKRIFVDYKIPLKIYHDILLEVDVLREEIETFGNETK
jgi:hypothetical protein